MPKAVKFLLTGTGIFLGILVLLFVIAGVLGLRMKRRATEMGAVYALEKIGQAEFFYASMHPERGYTCSLNELVDAMSKGGPAAQAILPSDFARSYWHGYIFTISGCSGGTLEGKQTISSFHLFAVPEALGKTGNRGFCLDQNNVVMVDRKGGMRCTEALKQVFEEQN